jgi:general secretion pathway protein A
VVDEAQNLSADVLEQLRLLSNLETTSSKLLQIILIGQPELAALLESEALRQLNQRINLSCELIPLSFKETREYIRHRIHIASSKPGPTFSSLAYRAIYRYAGGVPRRINIACDRALLTAFTQGKKEISYRIVRQALRELQSSRARGRPMTAGWGRRLVAVAAGAGILLAIAIGGHRMVDHFGGLSRFTGSAPRLDAAPSLPSAHSQAKEIESAIAALPPAPRPMAVEPLAVDGGAIAALPDAFQTPPPAPDLRAILAAATHRDSRIGAARAIVTAWGAREPVDIGTMGDGDDDAFFEAAARNIGLEALRVQTTLDQIQRLNMPSILAFPDPHGAGSRFLALIRSATDEIHLSDGRKVYGIAPASLTGVWAGDARIFWKNYYHYQGVIPISSPGDSILSLKLHLRNLGFPIPEMTAAFDVTTRLAIETIQNHYGLDVDGMVGPLTKIALYNEDRSLNIPRLTAPPQRRR